MPENPLRLLMNPRSIAVVGASNDFRKMGTIQALSILQDGYSGDVFFIHRKEKPFSGAPLFRRRPICRKRRIWRS